MVTKTNAQRGIVIQNVLDAQARRGVAASAVQIITCFLWSNNSLVNLTFQNRDILQQFLATGAADDYSFDEFLT